METRIVSCALGPRSSPPSGASSNAPSWRSPSKIRRASLEGARPNTRSSIELRRRLSTVLVSAGTSSGAVSRSLTSRIEPDLHAVALEHVPRELERGRDASPGTKRVRPGGDRRPGPRRDEQPQHRSQLRRGRAGREQLVRDVREDDESDACVLGDEPAERASNRLVVLVCDREREIDDDDAGACRSGSDPARACRDRVPTRPRRRRGRRPRRRRSTGGSAHATSPRETRVRRGCRCAWARHDRPLRRSRQRSGSGSAARTRAASRVVSATGGTPFDQARALRGPSEVPVAPLRQLELLGDELEGTALVGGAVDADRLLEQDERLLERGQGLGRRLRLRLGRRRGHARRPRQVAEAERRDRGEGGAGEKQRDEHAAARPGTRPTEARAGRRARAETSPPAQRPRRAR